MSRPADIGWGVFVLLLSIIVLLISGSVCVFIGPWAGVSILGFAAGFTFVRWVILKIRDAIQ